MPLRSAAQNANMSSGSSSTAVANNSLSYGDLSHRDKEILKRRPIHPHDISLLLKVSLQQFLRANNHPYKNAEKKCVLIQYVVDVISKTEATGTVSATAANFEKCDIPDELIRDLPVESQAMLKDMQVRPRTELENLLLNYGGVVSDVQTKGQLLCQLAELLSEQYRAQQGMNARQSAAKSPGQRSVNSLECCVCMEQLVSAGFNPCGHAISCMNCAEKLEQCPICRKKIDSVLHLYFA